MNFSRDGLLDRRYCVTHVLAQHGSETHYAARHVALDRPVRLVVSTTHSGTAQVESVCVWTTRVAALRHPVLPHVRDCFGLKGGACVVMDEAQGQTLRERVLLRGPLTDREAVAVGLLVADALDYVMRSDAALAPLVSITPDTIAFTSDDRVALTYLRPRGVTDHPDVCQCPRCRAYQAPEVMFGEQADVRADMYSLAATLRFALGASASEIGAATEDSRQATNNSYAIAPILARALARDPQERFETPAEFASALVEVGAALPALSLAAPHAAERPTRSSSVASTIQSQAPLTATNLSIRAPRSGAHARHSGRRALIAIASAFHFPG